MPRDETWERAVEKAGASESLLAGVERLLGGVGAVADHELVALLCDLDGPRGDRRIVDLEAGSTAGELQRPDATGGTELEQ